MTRAEATTAISRATARRFLVHHHLLVPPRSLPSEPSSVLTVIERLGSLQFDPLDVAGRNHDLTLLARIEGYQRAWTDEHLYVTRTLFEAYNKGLSILPTAELPLHRVTWDRARARHDETSFREHATLVDELLNRVRAHGPLVPGDIPARAAIDWYWRPTNQVRALLEALAEAGVLGLSRRDGNRRVYDLAERLFPEELLATRLPARDQFRHKLLSRYRAHGLLGASGSAELWHGTSPRVAQGPELDGELALGAVGRQQLLNELLDEGALMPVTVEGLRRTRYVLRDELPLLERALAEVEHGVEPGGHAPQVSFLAPLDPLVWDRDFLRQCYGFDYVWEVYVPEAKRRWGYYVLPILYGDQLVGRIAPRAHRASGTLQVLNLWWEADFDPRADERFVGALADALHAHRRFSGLAKISLPRASALRPLGTSLRAALQARND
ncbi:MAG: YcaQ family DNA glycosylase [Acidobacteriota bacterium]|nr:YcaQ family DNA glycosylase [Acidobacteriota bacterium]